MNVAAILLASYIKRFKEYKTLGDKTLAQLQDSELHFTPNDASNSIAVIIQHMHGNMRSRWTNFLTEDGEKSWRERDAEFEAREASKEELLALWEEGWAVCLATLESLQEDDLKKTITIRTQPLDVVDAINRQLAHYGYHVGQIVYLGRWIRNENWECLTIRKGESSAYTKKLSGK